MKVQIGPLTYNVVHVPDLRDTDDQKLYGYISYTDEEIRISADYVNSSRYPSILLHEIVHGVLDDRMPDNDVPEEVVLELANGLADTMARCPELLTILGGNFDQQTRKNSGPGGIGTGQE